MKHLYLNLKRFDVPVEYGGVNRIAPLKDWGGYIVTHTQAGLKNYDPSQVEFVQYFPEAHILGAVGARCEDSPVQVGCQGVYRMNTAVGGNFGAFTTNRPASIAKAMGCTSTIIGHCEERNDKTGILAEAGVTDLSFTMDVNNNWVAELAPQIKEDIDALGMGEVTIKEMKIDWASYAPSDQPLSYDVMLTPGDPTCFGNDPDLLMNWWYGDNVWTQGRSCWAKAEGSRWSELQDLMQQAREATGDAQQELWNQCFDIIAEEAPIYALFHRQTGTGWQESMITGFEPIGTTGLVFLGASATA